MRRLISIVATSAVILNSVIAPMSVLAQEASATPESTPEVASTPTNSPEPSAEATVSPSEEPTPTPISELETPPSPDSLSSVDNSPVEEQIVSETSATLNANNGEVEKVCLTNEEIKDSTENDWTTNGEEGYSETKEKVKLGIKYVFPQENKVSVTFKCLPKDESLRTNLKIQKVKVSDLNLPEGTNAYGEYAYDITTGMENGTFEYDITLPKATDSDSEVSYIEKTIDQAKEEVKSEDLQVVDSSKIKQGEDTVKATSIDHFTIYIVTANSTENNNSVSNPDKGWVSDNDYAVFDNKDDWVEYGFPVITNPTSITPGSTINGIEVFVEGYTSDKKDFEISIWNKSGNSYSTKKVATLSHTDNVYTLGSSTELWGKSWTVNDFSDANFKIKVDVNNGSGNAYLDRIEVKVHATDPIQNISNPTLSNSCGLTMALVLDSSASMATGDITTLKSAATGLVNALMPATPTKIGVVEFNTTVINTLNPTSTKADVLSAINSVSHHSVAYTNWDAALTTANSMVGSGGLVVVITDGNPNAIGNGNTNVTTSQAVTAAIVDANAIKTNGTRMLVVGVNSSGTQGGLNLTNLEAISGTQVVTDGSVTDINKVDVLTGDISQLAATLTNLTTGLCGGTVTVNKYIGSVSESNRAGIDWTFDIAGNSKTTDTKGQTEATTLSAGSNYSVTETNLSAWPGYSFSSAVCKNQTGATVGTNITNGVGSITVSDTDIISCDFVNTVPSSGIDWPNDWETPNSCISDPAKDENPGSTDLIGDSTTPAVGFKVDSTYAYFRERVNGNPAGSGGYDQYAWVVLFQISKPQYQYLFSLNGKDEKVQLWQNTSPAGPVDFSPLLNDPAETLLWSQDAYLYSRIVSNSDGSYYVDWAIPLTELQSRGIDPSVTKFFATSANENNYNKDHLNCYNNLCDIGVDKTDSADPVYKGDAFSYTITVTNTGSDTAENVIVSDTLPANFSLTSVSSSQGACTALPCNLGSIASGASATITITGSGTADGTLTNVASANTSTLDIDLTNNSDSEDTVVNEKNGNIIIEKQTIPDGSFQTFEFDPSWSVSNFPLSDGGQNNSSLIAGNYSITEIEPPGWELTNVSCVSSIKDAETASNLELDAGETITCTFTNTKLPKLTVVKSLLPVADPGLFNLQIDSTTYAYDVGNGGSTGTQIRSVGQHSVGETAGTETSLSDYNTTYSPNCPSGVITLAAGDDETCTITNIRKTGNIIIDKYVSGGSAQPSDWTFVISTVLGAIGSYHDSDNPTLNTGSYTITETGPEGYTLTAVSGTCTKIASDSGTLIVTEAGGTCTFENTRDTGSVKVNKEFDSDANGTYESGNTEANVLGFAWKLDSGTNTAMGTPIDGVETTAGSTIHSVNEYNPGNYHFTGWYTNGSRYSCASPEGTTLPISINVSKDVTTEITLCNARDVGSIAVEKDVVPNDSSTWNFTVTSVPAGYQGNVNLSDGGLHTFTNLPTGDYLIAETAEAGTNASEYIPTFSGDCVDREATPPGLYIHIEAGESKSCKITNTKKAKIIVEKITDPTGSDQSFHFNGNYTSGFDLKDTETNDSGWMDYHSPYYVSEDLVTDWSLSNISCVESINQNSTVNLTSNKVDITLEPGEIVTCTFTNTRDTGYLYFTKTVDPHYVTDSPKWNFSIGGTDADAGGWDLGDGEWGGLQLPTGTYSLTEVAKPTNDPTKTYDSIYRCMDIDSPGASFPTTGTYTITGTGTSTGNLVVQKDHTMWCEFINTERGSITVHKFEDKNKDGQQNNGDQNLQGWQMYLYNGNSCNPASLITNGSTDINGLITFGNLIPGTYSVYDNYYWTNPNTNPAEPTNGSACRTVTISAGQSQTIDYGNFIRWQLTGKKFVDTNGNGVWNAGESPKQGVRIEFFIYDNGQWIVSPINESYITKADGSYTYQSLDPRPFKVCEVVPTGWQRTMPSSSNCYEITPESGGNYTNYDFGNFELTYIQGRKFNDLNANGSQDGGEPEINSWPIRLYDSGWNQIGSDQLTHFISGNGDGRYRFENLFKGTYYICEVLQDGWTQTYPGNSEGVANGSGALDEAPRCQTATVAKSGTPVTGRIFGNVELSDIHGYKFNDLDGDGVEDQDEPKLSGWKIFIDKDDDQTWDNGEQFMLTDSGQDHFGWYWFLGLIPGTYSICEEAQSGWSQTTAPVCHTVQLPYYSGENTCGQEMVNRTEEYVPTCNFGNQEDKFEVTIDKTNDKSSGAGASDTVTYTLVVTNNGNRSIYNLDVKDFLPGGFSYITGTTTGDTTNDPTVSGGTLAWEDVDNELTAGETFTINYQVKIATDVSDGIYKNYATCRGNIRSQKESIECDPDDSTVTIGSNLGYSGSLSGQVLGISTSVLPATGNQTWILIAAFASIALGVFLNIYARKEHNKKNDQK